MQDTQHSITFRTDRQPGDLGRIVWLHGIGYKGEDGNHFGPRFEAYVAGTVAEFGLERDGKGVLIFAERGGEPVGCAAMLDRSHIRTGQAQLRWVVALPELRGLGIGQELIARAITIARAEGYTEVFLETTDGLDAAMGIYQKLGFEETSSRKMTLWTEHMTMIEMVLRLHPS